MLRRLSWDWIALFATLILFGVASYLPLYSMWGINHLAFLPNGFGYAFALVAIAVVYLWRMKGEPRVLDDAMRTTADMLWLRGPIPRLVISGCLGILFWLLKPDTHFLGDGYTLLSVFSQGPDYIKRWAEPGSIFLVRQIQTVLGEYTRSSALLTFQILSVTSGILVVNNFVLLAGRLTTHDRKRLFALLTLLSSGVVLQFMGYVEYYPLLWACATSFVVLAMRYIETGRGLVWTVLLFVLSVSMHFQALYFLPGFIYCVLRTHSSKRGRPITRIVSVTIACACTVAIVIATAVFFKDRIELLSVFVPLIAPAGQHPGYSLFSLVHLLDLISLSLVMLPVLLMLVLNQAVWTSSHERDETGIFLLMLTVGSVLFLTLIDPKLGMARDWDLMSLTMLAPALWLLRRLSEHSSVLTSPKLIGTALLSLFITVCFVATNGITSASEARFNSIVNYYGTKDDTGSVILAYYYLNRGDLDKAQAITLAVAEINSRKADIFQLLGLINKKSGNLEAAANNFVLAIKAKPYQPRLKNELGQVYLAQGKPREALQVLRDAHHDDPHLTFVMEGIGLAYFRMGLVDSTTLIADSLFRQEPDSPGGHILRMIVAIQENDIESARLHYQAFLKIGSQRSDFKSIRESYRFLMP